MEGWCLETPHEYFDNFLFVKQWMFSIDDEVDEKVIFEKKPQAEEGASPRIINTDQDA